MGFAADVRIRIEHGYANPRAPPDHTRIYERRAVVPYIRTDAPKYANLARRADQQSRTLVKFLINRPSNTKFPRAHRSADMKHPSGGGKGRPGGPLGSALSARLRRAFWGISGQLEGLRVRCIVLVLGLH